MKRIFIAVLLVAIAIATFGGKIEINTDADAIFPDARINVPSLDDLSSREVIVTLNHADLKYRNRIARALATSLAANPLIEEVNFSSKPPSEEFRDWVWDNRFHLSPPEASDFDSAQMAIRLEEAVDYFSNINSMIHGDRFLLDPTGSYWRLVQTLQDRKAEVLVEQDGVWQSYDQSAAVLHLRLTDHPFNATEVQSFTESIRSFATKEDVKVHVLGVRVIAAETTLFNTSASTRASALATILLLCWLVWSLRSFTAALFAFLPVALGITAAFITVTLIFDAVHIIALAFGGVLLGLGLDYPLHAMGYPENLRPRTHRLIFLGALTTGISFLAMVGSQVPALVQTGIFILVGLIVSAIATILLPSPSAAKMRGISLHDLSFRLPAKNLIEYSMAVLGVIAIVFFSKESSITLFEPPQQIRSDIGEMALKLDLPSKKFAIKVQGDSLSELLKNEEQLAQTLDREVEKGNLQSYKMLSQVLPAQTPALVKSSIFQSNVRAALTHVGMSIEYSKQQLEAYEHALSIPALNQDDLARFSETADLAKRVKVTEDGWRELVQLVLPISATQPEFTVTSTGTEIIDLLAPLKTSMATLQLRMSFWLLIGLICGLGVLVVGLKSWSQVGQILRMSCAVLGASACFLILFYGSLNLFHIVAMALVLGIGVDYTIFMEGLNNKHVSADTSTTSIYVCAISTLIAFTVLAFSEVQILHQIGTTVVIGLLLMLFLILAQSGSSKE